MIWSNQWDEICKYINKRGDKVSLSNSNLYGNYKNVDVKNSAGNSTIKEYGVETLLETGKTDFTRTNNIYDLAGNCWEATQGTCKTNGRTTRGGSFNQSISDYSVTICNYFITTAIGGSLSSRASLYLI